MVTVKIIKCSGDGYWYCNKIGQYFDVEEKMSSNTTYDVKTGAFIPSEKNKRFHVIDSIKTIDECDCKIISISDKINRIKNRMKDE